ncbi:MAG: 30S ribosomal protein THX [Flavobacteriaceae bacterium]|nr:30S ribosomal protein THX [Flavobacteriaceae bacterium]
MGKGDKKTKRGKII